MNSKLSKVSTPSFFAVANAVGFIGTAMFFPLIPLYPAVNEGEWSYLLLCYACILFGVILSNKATSGLKSIIPSS